jgi:phosphoribosylanthranilate isomerase
VRAALPHLKIIRTVHVQGPGTIARARALERHVDAILLDTFDAQTGRAGATGKTHDWAVSREVVERVRAPVVLAGGLTAENVARAIERVRPWAVDVHTGVEDERGNRDFAKIREFVRAAQAGAA